MITLRLKADVQHDRKVIVTLPPDVPTIAAFVREVQ